MKAEDKITKARTAIMRDPRFMAMSGVLMVGTWEVRDDVPTAGTNGRDVVYGRAFINDADDKLTRFVVLHEYFHVMLMHMTVWQKMFEEDGQTANFAADAVINLMLDDLDPTGDFLTVWDNAVLDQQYRGMDTGEIYRAMKKKQNGKPQDGSGSGNGKSSDKPKAANGKEAQQFDKHEPAKPDAKGDGEGMQPLTPAEAEEVKRTVDSALRQGALIAGKIGADVSRAFGDLLEPQVDWAEQLREWLRTTAAGNDLSTWRKPSRRWLAQDTYMPSRYTEAVRRVTIGVDTSGSISQVQLQRALTEIMCACDTVRPEIVDVIYWDSRVAAHEVYEGEAVQTLAQTTKPKGGGGTRVGSMREYMEREDIKPEATIVFTDGYVEPDWGGQWPGPVLWAISTKGMRAPSGVSLYVPV
jgi:predicted metal-dependent peptidase